MRSHWIWFAGIYCVHLYCMCVFNITWRIMHAAAAAAAALRLFCVCIPVRLSAIFQLPCCFNTHSSPLCFWSFLLWASCFSCWLKKWPRMPPDEFRSYAKLTGPEVYGALEVFGMWSLSATHARSTKCSIESVVYQVSLRTAQEKLHETPCLLQRSARLRPDLKWIHLSLSWPDLTWMSHSLVSGPGGLLFFSLQLLFQHALIIAPTSSRHVDEGVWARALVRCCTYERGCGRLFVFSNILHCVWRVVLEQQEQELNNFPNGYLWPSEKYVPSLPILQPMKSLSLFQHNFAMSCAQNERRAVVQNLDLMHISFAPRYQVNKWIALALSQKTQSLTRQAHDSQTW